MRTKYVFLIFLHVFAVTITAQNFKVGDLIKLNNTVPVNDAVVSIYSDDSNSEKTVNHLESGIIFRILELSNTEVKLIALSFKTKTEKQKEKLLASRSSEKLKSDYYNNKVYTISLKDFNAFAQSFQFDDRISVGLITLPFRARPQDDFSFDIEFNLSTTVNIRIFDVFGSSLNAQLGAGISSVGLNSENALGITGGESQDVATLTMFSGLMLQYKKVQIGLYAGVDQINNQSNYQWKSNGNLWFGLGVGFNIFTISISDPKNKQ
ncbi:hypothetical protein [Winogradskyella bathintestinalis]|uniref:Outer membrane protein beta-barrel domain-containing protein n=1 Tax=Winogradskyella bathintestinalis TaxID=3035208 RepID=A0ABT7ZVN1_9FLAO|nr:hypothetical protein [Winogradskyella bathintestinalis]MDN3493077.1 hypothetical protein [Winogradskyella bathintestinalis]